MSIESRLWMEVPFNIAYLLVIWGLVVAMLRNGRAVAAQDKPVARRVLCTFVVLGLGDTPHVISRILAWVHGSMSITFTVFGWQISTVGLGALATSITLTLFYVVMLEVWRVRFHKRLGWFEYLLLTATVVRFALFFHPANRWNDPIAPSDWSIYRNIPLFYLGLGMAYLLWRDARRANDRTFLKIAWTVVAAYACYIPVILLYHRMPMIGMLMILKMAAYALIGIFAYRGIYGKQRLAIGPGVPA